MNFGAGTVFVLGAGFTKAFVPEAPLLVDDYYGADLHKAFERFPAALAVLNSECQNPDHKHGFINIERLMTRLAGGMPYDFVPRPNEPISANHELDFLLAQLKKAFMRRLAEARDSKVLPEELLLFAQHVCRNKNHCITFNYDTLLEDALWSNRKIKVDVPPWYSQMGYGFPCRYTAELKSAVIPFPLIESAMVLYKMHGSMNWRVPRGATKPVQANTIHLHESWFMHPHIDDLASLSPLLEEEPVFVPPILTKTGLVKEPVLQLVWSGAQSALKDASRVVFMGYSLPITDIAAAFLFSEGLSHLSPDKVTVVDLAMKKKRQKLRSLLESYGRIARGMTKAQIDLGGAQSWISKNLSTTNGN